MRREKRKEKKENKKKEASICNLPALLQNSRGGEGIPLWLTLIRFYKRHHLSFSQSGLSPQNSLFFFYLLSSSTFNFPAKAYKV